MRLRLALLLVGLLGPHVVFPGSCAAGAEMVNVRGVVRAQSSATIASEIQARISQIPLKEGQAFHQGDLLLSFDCRRYEADLQAAEAEVKIRKIEVETNRQLLSRRAVGSNELALSEAKLAQAEAAAESLRVRASQCIITAPYDGHIIERIVDVFEMPQPNTPLLKIVKDGALEIDIIAPSSWSVWLKPGYEFRFLIDETQTEHRVVLMQVGAVIDPVSRTLAAWGHFIDGAPEVRPGMSGTAKMVMAPSREDRDGR
ncbi:MAG TPA: HlyD family efflux transporter periplasmic adaptor subunit [Hyphomicrobiaceae bacterium]|nr:HlyD family efflux transporter periplasmic adaptor subunit [Hyphomicrobiaceae bacterium]